MQKEEEEKWELKHQDWDKKPHPQKRHLAQVGPFSWFKSQINISVFTAISIDILSSSFIFITSCSVELL